MAQVKFIAVSVDPQQRSRRDTDLELIDSFFDESYDLKFDDGAMLISTVTLIVSSVVTSMTASTTASTLSTAVQPRV